jgi:hypothetical protein
MVVSDGVGNLILTNGKTLGRALLALEKYIDPDAGELDAMGFDFSP